MNQTDQQSNPPGTPSLNAALAKAQAAMGPAVKDKINPHFGSRYADLAAVMEVVREPLAANGLAVVQLLAIDDRGVTVTTQLRHSSGELIESPCWLPAVQRSPQGYGSAITYARRYGLAALLGIAAEEDDDGNAASAARAPSKAPAPRQKQTAATRPGPAAESGAGPAEPAAAETRVKFARPGEPGGPPKAPAPSPPPAEPPPRDEAEARRRFLQLLEQAQTGPEVTAAGTWGAAHLSKAARDELRPQWEAALARCTGKAKAAGGRS